MFLQKAAPSVGRGSNSSSALGAVVWSYMSKSYGGGPVSSFTITENRPAERLTTVLCSLDSLKLSTGMPECEKKWGCEYIVTWWAKSAPSHLDGIVCRIN